MIIFNAILVGLKEVWAHKFRSLLTMLGIILGVASLVGMAALVKGMENGMKETMIALGGADKVLLQDEDVPTWQEHLADQAPGRTMRDAEALRVGAPLIKIVSPEMELDDAFITRGNRFFSPSECNGVTSAALEVNLHTLQYGRFFTARDEAIAANVCVIGTGIRDALFGTPEEAGSEIVPLGETIYINSQPFVIVGMFTPYESESDRLQRQARQRNPEASQQVGPDRRRGWGRGGNWAFYLKNNMVYMPMQTMWLRFRAAGTSTNSVPDPRLSSLELKVKDVEKLEEALQQARNILMITHNGIEDFSFRTQENQVENINTQIRNARLSGGILASISLIVGGIGIMNIMLASINERVREIGICKAVGASGPAIFLQILIESVVISLLGAAAGIAASFGLVELLKIATPTQNTPVIQTFIVGLAVCSSICVGVLAGFFPAWKASRFNPIQALRYE